MHGNVEHKDRQAGQAKMYQPPMIYVCTAPFSQCFSLTPLVLFVLLCTALLGRYSAGWMNGSPDWLLGSIRVEVIISVFE